MMTITLTRRENDGIHKSYIVEMPLDSSLTDVLPELEEGLLALGYRFDGQLDFVNDEN